MIQQFTALIQVCFVPAGRYKKYIYNLLVIEMLTENRTAFINLLEVTLVFTVIYTLWADLKYPSIMLERETLVRVLKFGRGVLYKQL